MSGPIVRKYGFPNFDKIFGERPLEHGVDDEGHLEERNEGDKRKKGEKKAPSATKRAKPKES
jgi:hypothetical protein